MSVTVVAADTVTTWPGTGPVRGDDLLSPEVHTARSIGFSDGVIVAEPDPAGESIDARGLHAVPGFVDCHTHVPFHGWRADEDAARLAGVRYETIHGESGGIFRSARQLAAADDDEVVAWAAALTTQMLRAGTTTFEMKSGYGLSVEAELRQLRLARSLAERVPQLTTATCLAAHAVPPDDSAGGWIGRAATELLPQAVQEGLIDAVDLYVETIAFALEHAARLVETAASLGLRMRVHADQLADNQTASFAARWELATADHLNHTSPDGVGDLAASETVAVLLPGATFTLRQTRKPPARALIDEGAVVALGTDLNPGTSPVASMPFVMALACRTYGLRPLEAVAAGTVNAAHALGLGDRVGRLEPGYRGDVVLLDTPPEEIAYRPDRDPVAAVVCAGDLVYVAPDHRHRVG